MYLISHTYNCETQKTPRHRPDFIPDQGRRPVARPEGLPGIGPQALHPARMPRLCQWKETSRPPACLQRTRPSAMHVRPHRDGPRHATCPQERPEGRGITLQDRARADPRTPRKPHAQRSEKARIRCFENDEEKEKLVPLGEDACATEARPIAPNP